MTGGYQYSVLKYRHSFLLGEVVNVGLLLYFQEGKELLFIHPRRLERISHLYPDIAIKTIRYYLSLFSRKAIHLTKDWQPTIDGLLNVDFATVLHNEFLIEDASALYFDEIKTGIATAKNKIVEYYYREYFSCYDLVKPAGRKDEEYITKLFRQKIINRTQRADSIKKLEINKKLTNGLVEETFKLGWQNGSFNLVVPIAFDLQEKQSIEHKSLTWFGKLDFLGEKAAKESIRFDLLISKPTNTDLIEAYNGAVDIIQQSKAPVSIISESDFDRYVNSVEKYVLNAER